jgi:hypothetical protein
MNTEIDFDFGPEEVTKEIVLSDVVGRSIDLVGADDLSSYKWDTQELRRCYYYDTARCYGTPFIRVYLALGGKGSPIIIGYQIVDDRGIKPLEGRKAP